MKMLAVCCLLLSALCLRAELAFKWTVEVSQPLPYAAEALQGETFNLEAKVVQYRVPMLEAAEATFYYQTPEMEASQWYTTPAAWDATTATASVAFTPAMDVGSTKYRFFFGIETAQGKNYRVFGTLRLKASPGFSPATLTPTDVRAEIIQEILEAVFEESDERYATKAEHAALAVQVDGKADASHTHSDLVKQRDVQQVLNESENPVSAKAVYQNVGNVVRNPDIVDVVRYVDAGSLQEIGDRQGKAIFAADSNGQGGIIVGGSPTSMPSWTRWTAKLNWDKIRAYNDPGLYEDYSFKPGESNQIARIKDLPAAITIDTALSSTSTNPVQNNVVKTALDGKAPTSHTHTIAQVSDLQTQLNAKAALSTVSALTTRLTAAEAAIEEVAEAKQDKLTIDTALSSTSTNPVQNKTIAGQLATRTIATAFGGYLMDIATDNGTGIRFSTQDLNTYGYLNLWYLNNGGVGTGMRLLTSTALSPLYDRLSAVEESVQHTHAFEDLSVTVSGASYRWQWDETEGTFALVAEE